jgi:hypothetical protein
VCFCLFCFCFYFFCIIKFTINIFLPLLLSSSFSLLFLCYNPLFFLPTMLSALLSTFSPLFTCLSYPSPTCHHTTSPSYTLNTCGLVYCTNCIYPKLPHIPDINTLHYNNRNPPKHTQGRQHPAAPIPLPLSTSPFSEPSFLVPPLSITQVSISSLKTIPPQFPLL